MFYFGNTMNTENQEISSIINYHQTKIKIQQNRIKLSFVKEQKLKCNFKNSHHLP